MHITLFIITKPNFILNLLFHLLRSLLLSFTFYSMELTHGVFIFVESIKHRDF